MNNINWWSVFRGVYSLLWIVSAWGTRAYFQGQQVPVTTKSIVTHGVDEYVLKRTVYQYPDDKWYWRERGAVALFFVLAIPMVASWFEGL